MATLYLICGLPGSGKTTLAKQLEYQELALRLTPDEWMMRIVGDGYNEEKRSVVEAMQWEIAARVLSLGINVVLEYGFWSRRERNEMRSKAAAIGAQTKLHFLDVSKEELLRRIKLRNATLLTDTFHINETDIDLWWDQFERPASDEFQ